MPPTWAFGLVILAAGHSARMGRPKLLLPWSDTSVLGHLLRQWTSLGAAQIAVVCRSDDVALHAELERLEFPTAHRIPNPEADRGMFSSVQRAARWIGWAPDVDSVAISLGDQPHVSVATLAEIVQFARAHPNDICQPGRAGHGRHPVFIPAPLFRELAIAQVDTLKQFLASKMDSVKLIEADDQALDVDLDTPADYEQARELWKRSAHGA